MLVSFEKIKINVKQAAHSQKRPALAHLQIQTATLAWPFVADKKVLFKLLNFLTVFYHELLTHDFVMYHYNKRVLQSTPKSLHQSNMNLKVLVTL